MPATIAESRDQMNALIKGAVDNGGAATTGLVVIWDDVEKQPDPPAPPTPWARVKVMHATGGARSIGNAQGKIRYVRGGTIVVQLFTPGGKGLVSNDQLVAIILAAYEGKTTAGGHVFRSGRFQEVGEDGVWFQTNVFIDFEYDQIL